ncbi:MAG: putative endoribonuclease [Phycisphaerales bacterium]|nr:MAG: putative endoribonuclease [Phycisphaerales bacterium]
MTDIRRALADLSITLPEPPPAVASYVPVRLDGHHAWVSGQLPMVDGRLPQTGHVGEEVSLEQAQVLARQCVINALAALDAFAGGLENIAGIVRVGGVYVACGPAFADHPKVGNGASELLEAVLGPAGRHARAAVGCASLPMASPVEIELVARLHRAVDAPGS